MKLLIDYKLCIYFFQSHLFDKGTFYSIFFNPLKMIYFIFLIHSVSRPEVCLCGLRPNVQVQAEPNLPSALGMQQASILSVSLLPLEGEGKEFVEAPHGYPTCPGVPTDQQ